MKNIDKILLAIDFSDSSQHACEYALTLASQFNSKLLILHVINEPVDLRGFYVPHISFDRLEQEIEEGARKMMDQFVPKAMGSFTNFETCIVSGIPYDEILKKADDENTSMIILGTHGRTGIDHLLFGSTAERVVRTAKCPVLTVRMS
ncbi:universal stress protein [Geobacter pelophilus]|uniref:Universal stress protein n=1 Tax=Geoanaerobacter pelophilus TaxID=60036 RepID=A0AAW4L1J7_9BACT|nr:universal stress protein [Geoanaerobacter pelophilus]MBT0662843.1 universal stress protein [Geoanaerobacter pelophilus]